MEGCPFGKEHCSLWQEDCESNKHKCVGKSTNPIHEWSYALIIIAIPLLINIVGKIK